MAWEPQKQLCVLEWFLANGVGAAAANLESNGNAAWPRLWGFKRFIPWAMHQWPRSVERCI